MYEEALEIHKYLPIRKSSLEDEYITHLWQTFFTLDSSNELVQPFMMMPFHLLFMMALQYKALRMSKELNNEYSLVFTIKNFRDAHTLSQPNSVFDFSLLLERTLPDLFRLINLEESLISRIKKLVDYRNDKLAHANGGIAQEFSLKIEEYLDCLREIQKKFLSLNNLMAKEFTLEMTADDVPSEFIEIKLLNSYLCQADFNEGVLKDVFGAVGSYI